ncbi:hypothetical protein L2E82_20214 [Cichorium intybus]|uniref:Uncharacterized protein n=1 Tax=Cichorium intybus TaxID=13427 RepID=A0ACB9DT28_CICIN|nr:hypothetical protein L2E82_20214 [Cichorium intybus]
MKDERGDYENENGKKDYRHEVLRTDDVTLSRITDYTIHIYLKEDSTLTPSIKPTKNQPLPYRPAETCHSAFLTTNSQLHADTNIDDSMSKITSIVILVCAENRWFADSMKLASIENRKPKLASIKKQNEKDHARYQEDFGRDWWIRVQGFQGRDWWIRHGSSRSLSSWNFGGVTKYKLQAFCQTSLCLSFSGQDHRSSSSHVKIIAHDRSKSFSAPISESKIKTQKSKALKSRFGS